MSSHPALTTSLEKLLDADPSLQAALRRSQDVDKAVEVVLAAAGRHGIDLDAAELAARLQTLDSLQRLVNTDTSLLEELKKAEEVEEAVEVILASARRHRIELNIDDLSVHLRTVAEDATNMELTDDQLSDVTGGVGLPLGTLVGGAIASALGGTTR